MAYIAYINCKYFLGIVAMHNKFIFYQTSSYQATIAIPIVLSGRAAFFDNDTSVELRPSEPGSGITFHWKGEQFPGNIEFLLTNAKFRTTALTYEAKNFSESVAAIFTVEHLLSSLYGLGISNCQIHVQDNGMIPFFDGSSHEFCDKIISSGIKIQDKFFKPVVYCQNRIRVVSKDAYVQIDPPTTGGLKISANIIFPEPIGKQSLTYFHSGLSYALNIAWARTFSTRDFDSEESIKKFLPAFRMNELFNGSYIESPMLVFKDNKYITSIRRHDEAVRHKVLDLLGDICLLGFELYGDIKIYKSGHKLNWEFTKIIHESIVTKNNNLQTFSGVALKPRYKDDQSKFIRDVTVNDGTCFKPREKFIKIWEIQNAGNVPWVGRALMREGPSIGFGIISSEPITFIQPVAPGEKVQVKISLVAPDAPGCYRAEWKMVDSEGRHVFPNQNALFVVIRVAY